MRKVQKRNGNIVDFDNNKIKMAIIKANESVEINSHKLNLKQIDEITDEIEVRFIKTSKPHNVETIQDIVENTFQCKLLLHF